MSFVLGDLIRWDGQRQGLVRARRGVVVWSPSDPACRGQEPKLKQLLDCYRDRPNLHSLLSADDIDDILRGDDVLLVSVYEPGHVLDLYVYLDPVSDTHSPGDYYLHRVDSEMASEAT